MWRVWRQALPRGILALVVSSGAVHDLSAQVATAAPLPVNAVLDVRTFNPSAPFKFSRDGRWLAFTVADAKRVTVMDALHAFFAPSGVGVQMLGNVVWVADTRSGALQQINGEESTGWGGSWSPDGRTLAFYSDEGGAAHLWLWDARTNRRRMASEAIVHPFFPFELPRWTADGKAIVVKLLPEGETIDQAARLAAEGTRPPDASTADSSAGATVYRSALTASGADSLSGDTTVRGARGYANYYRGDLAVIDVVTGAVRRLVRDTPIIAFSLSPDGQTAVYAVVRGRAAAGTLQPLYDLAVVSLSSGASHVIAPLVPQDYGLSVSWSPDGSALAYTVDATFDRADSVGSSGDCFLVSLSGGAPRLLTPGWHPPLRASAAGPLWAPRGDYLYVLGGDTLWRIAVRDQTLVPILAIPGHHLVQILSAELSGRIWSLDGGRSLYVRTLEVASRRSGIARVDLRDKSWKMVIEEDKEYGTAYLGVEADGPWVAYVAQDQQHPEDLWLADTTFRRVRRVTHLNPVLDRYVYGASRNISWRSVDGTLLHGIVVVPSAYKEGQRAPLIVDAYGGTFRSQSSNHFGGVSFGAVANLQLLATRGYAVFVPDIPLGFGTPMLDIAKAVLPGVDKVIQLGIADPERVGVMGWSDGGYATLSLLVQTRRFKAAVSGAGMSDLVSAYATMNLHGEPSFLMGWAEQGQGRIGGTPWNARSRFIENSPFFYLDRIQTPILLVHGTADPVVPSFLSDQTFVALQRLGKAVEYVKYPGEGHGLEKPADIRDYTTRVIRWFDRYLFAGAASHTSRD
jgi:dipeptidyl aminopeptidase/acylaminoacyl peptidase